MKTRWTVDDVMRAEPCGHYTREYVQSLFGKRSSVDAWDIAHHDGAWECERLWALMHVCMGAGLRADFARWCNSGADVSAWTAAQRARRAGRQTVQGQIARAVEMIEAIGEEGS